MSTVLSKSEITVVGIDAAFANMGFVKVVVDLKTRQIARVLDMKLVSTEKTTQKQARVGSDRIRRGRELLQEMRVFCYGSMVAVAEVPEGSQSASAAWALGIATGILCACPVSLIEVSSLEVKKSSVGKKTASKEEMRQWAYEKWPDAPWLKHGGKLVQKNEHLADALASVEAGIRTEQFKGYAGWYSTKELLDMPMEDEPPARRRLQR